MPHTPVAFALTGEEPQVTVDTDALMGPGATATVDSTPLFNLARPVAVSNDTVTVVSAAAEATVGVKRTLYVPREMKDTTALNLVPRLLISGTNADAKYWSPTSAPVSSRDSKMQDDCCPAVADAAQVTLDLDGETGMGLAVTVTGLVPLSSALP